MEWRDEWNMREYRKTYTSQRQDEDAEDMNRYNSPVIITSPNLAPFYTKRESDEE